MQQFHPDQNQNRREVIRFREFESESSQNTRHTDFQTDIKPAINPEKTFLLALVGIPGCGKSTFATSLIDELNKNDTFKTKSWKSYNQDVLGKRHNVYNGARAHLETRSSVIIDRCNFDVTQRSHWIKLAREYKATPICIILPHCTNVALCIERAYSRGNDGIHGIDVDWEKVCNIMKNSYVQPSLDEGFQKILELSPDNSNEMNLNIILNSLI
eukprot:gene348-620_t